ncbi:MAG: RagB/SusD family nutrient uptake outer membrane protein [Muribaculaceae bacterium]|nr:RagB/SusD family nutrient uptake outer membrane protein [Muribaculaceae bacterium]
MKKFIFSFLFALVLSGCSLNIPYDNQFSDPDAITTPTTGRELLASAYSALPNPGLDLAVLSDDFLNTYWASRDPGILNQYNWQPQSFIDLAQSLWPEYYDVIVRANALIERIPFIKISTEADRLQVMSLEAEAYTLKAYCYFNLLRLFASDPAEGLDKDGIILKQKVLMEDLPRSTVGETIEEIRRLLTRAIELDPSSTSVAWLNTNAAKTLLSKVELYAGNYEEAASIASQLIDSAGYDVFTESVYRTLWNSTTCREQLFIFDSPLMSQYYYIGIQYDADMGDYFMLPPAIASSFEPSDCRTEWTVVPYTSQTLGEVSFIGKYNLLRRDKKQINFVNKLRYSDALFAGAESYCRAGNSTKAIEMVNNFLRARGASEIDETLSGDDLLKEILWQKQKEFLGEGERFFDMKINRRLLASMFPTRIPGPDDYRWVWPIPKEEYLYNDKVTQNPGWPRVTFTE